MIKNERLFRRNNRSHMVEVRGVEPLSENTLLITSPGADDYLHSLKAAGVVTLRFSVASLYMACAKLSTLTFTTRRRLIPDRGPSG